MTLWHPHTERPAKLCSCLIAIPPEADDDDGARLRLAGTYYTYNPRTDQFRCERTGIPLRAAKFYWVDEDDVVPELEALKP